MDPDQYEAYIRAGAVQRGMDPDIAVKVAKSEGLNGPYSGDQGSSFGPFQLHYGNVAPGGNAVSGLGDNFTAQTGLDARDPSTVPQQIDFALDHAAQNGWGAWHGWKGSEFAGIPNQPQQAQMPDQTQQQQQPQAGFSPSVLFGTANPTPIGAIGGIARMLGIGSEPELGRRLQNAGAALMSVGNFGKPGAPGAAMMQEAANQPHFNVASDAYGNRIAYDTRSGQPIGVNGMGYNGQPLAGFNQTPGQAGSSVQQQMAQTPNARMAAADANAKSDAETVKALEDAAASADGAIDKNQQALRLSQDPDVIQGPGWRNEIADRWAEFTNSPAMSKMADLDKLNSGLVGDLLSAQHGIRFAAPEIKFGQTAQADREKPAATNQQIYNNNIQSAQRVKDIAAIARNIYGQTGALGPEFHQAVQDYMTKHPIAQDVTVNPTSQAQRDNRPPLNSFFK